MGSRIRLHIENVLAARGALVGTSCGRWVRPHEAVTHAQLGEVTCRLCLQRAHAGSHAKPRKHGARLGRDVVTSDQLAHELHLAISAEFPDLGAHAGSPPRLDSAVWTSSCRGGEHRRCGECVICEWERSAELWAHVAPWQHQHREQRVEGSPRWGTLDAALHALVAWHQHGRSTVGLRSATGRTLERLAQGQCSSGAPDPRQRDPRAVVEAFDLVDVELRLAHGVQQVAGGLNAATLVACVLARVLDPAPTFAELALQHEVTEATLRASVRRVRAVVGALLVEAGLVAAPLRRSRALDAPISVMRAPDDLQELAS